MKDISQFPVSPYLEKVCSELKDASCRFMILTAETGAGKSTILPIGLLNGFSGKIIMTEPRRLAVVGVANRVSDLLEEPCGKSVGYKIHLENKISKETRLEVVTEAVLLRYLQEDPSLDGISVVVIDEFHERSVYTDLNLAFLKEAMEFRDDLFVIIMSATIDTDKLSKYLNSPPVFKIPGRVFPVSVFYESKNLVVQAIVKEIQADSKNPRGILVFLPGISEIRKNQKILEEEFEKEIEDRQIEISVLHSSISFSEQKYVLAGGNSKAIRIILSSAIAETSVTVPGITCVIDSGFSRINRMNFSTGMENLVTEIESEFSAQQRCGRAGRVGPGKCIRLWGENEPRIKNIPPEILRTDLSEIVLECAERGIYNSDGIDWLDKPSDGAWKGADNLLKQLGLLKNDGRISEKGKLVLLMGLSPRLACIAIEMTLLKSNDYEQWLLKYGNYSAAAKEVQNHYLAEIRKRLENNRHLLDKISPSLVSIELGLLEGFPDRLAKRISEIGSEKACYQFPSGRKAVFADKTSGSKGGMGSVPQVKANFPQWIVAPEVLSGNSTEGIIFSFEELPDEKVLAWLENRSEKKQICFFENGKLLKQEIICYGQLILSVRKLQTEKEDLLKAWINEVKTKGIDVLPKDKKTELFLQRVAYFYQQTKEENISLEEKIVSSVEEWLPAFFGSSKQLTEEIVYNALYWYLDGQKIDKEVPEVLGLPNGRKCKVKYELQASPEDKNKLVIRPTIEIIIQRIFGCSKIEPILGMKVLLKLLSPASRPLQITDDLEGFWTGAWPEICKEMKGRYPKHCWDKNIICE